MCLGSFLVVKGFGHVLKGEDFRRSGSLRVLGFRIWGWGLIPKDLVLRAVRCGAWVFEVAYFAYTYLYQPRYYTYLRFK